MQNKYKFNSFKGRTVEWLQEVEVYRNLHKNCWSIRDVETGLVLGHAKAVAISDAYFVVNEKGRQRVIKEQKKNVHAVIRGFYINTDVPHMGVKVTYNPYKNDSFVTVLSAKPVHHNMNATLTPEMEVYI